MKLIIKRKKKKFILRGKTNREAGERFEFKLLRIFKGSALEACRSAGSRGQFDHWVLLEDKLRLIIAKTNGYLDSGERRALRKFFEVKPAWVQVEMHFYRNAKTKAKTIIRTVDDIRPYYK